ncbi:hypothetical protein [Paracoccus ravus]|uniref:hypothetical protein n=1 Tax=Paracoccus ravus TaxID=2447760 RepID=UPI001FD6ED29|nr:hypothetical protein [Paracoccus ravus]
MGIAPDRMPRDFGDQMAARPSAFGLDIEEVPESLPVFAAPPHLRIVGLHIHCDTQCLRGEANTTISGPSLPGSAPTRIGARPIRGWRRRRWCWTSAAAAGRAAIWRPRAISA